MKVTQVRTWMLVIPTRESYYSQGVATGVNCVLVEVETDENELTRLRGALDR